MKTKKLYLLFLIFILAFSNLIADDVLKIYHMQNCTESSNPGKSIIFQNKMIFEASGKLWQIDSTNSLKMIADSSYPFASFVLNDDLYYFTHYKKLWHYNGKDAPELLFNDVVTPSESKSYKVLNNKLYYYYGTGYLDYEDRGYYEFDGKNHPKKIAGDNSYVGNIQFLTNYNNRLYFRSSGLYGDGELWCYDNNESWMLADLNRTGSSNPENFRVYLGRLYFNAKDSTNTKYLWEYNGSGYPKKIASPGSGLMELNNILFFASQDSVNGISLWSYDGTNVPAIISGTENSDPSLLFVFNDKLYFKISSTIYEYDGTSPIKVVLGPIDYYEEPQLINGFLYIWCPRSNRDNSDLYKFDGRHPAVNLTASMDIGTNFSKKLITVNNQVFVIVNGHVYLDDGDSLRMISTFPAGYYERVTFGNKFYFTCFHPLYGYELWSFDGINAPVLVKDLNSKKIESGSHLLRTANDKLYLKDNENQYIQFNGTRFSVLPRQFNPVTVYNMLAYKNNYYYNRESGKISESLFKSDGLIEQKISNSSTCDLLVFHDTIYYGSYPYFGNYMLMKYDGVNAPVELANMGDHRICYMKIVNDKIRLFAFNDDSLSVGSYDGKALIWEYKNMPIPYTSTFIGIQFNYKTVFSYNHDLWIYDETQKPVKLSEIYPEFSGRHASNFKIYNNKLYFSAYSLKSNLWVYDGINPPSVVGDNGTQKIPTYPTGLTVANNKLYFSASEGTVNVLWVYDGVNKPVMVKNAEGDTLPNPMDLTAYRDNLYFTAITEQEGRQLYTICPNGSVIHETGCDSINFHSVIFKDSEWICDTVAPDSIVWFDLKVAKPTNSNLTASSCNEYVSPSGKHKWTTSGIYKDTIPNAAGCDSIITIQLQVKHSSGSIVYVQTCDSYLSPDGVLRTESGNYKVKIPNACGCDSTIDLTLHLDHVDTTVIQDRNVLVSADIHAMHQWIDADNNIPIEGETYLTYTPDHNGRFAVIVTQGTCVDTSSAYTVIVTGNEQFINGNIQLYPNPTSGKLTIDLGKIYDEATVTILNSTGRVIQEMKMRNTLKGEIVLAEPGMYLVKVRTGDGETIHSVIKQ